MAESDLDDVKISLRSILTSFPGIPSIYQVLEDYERLEGHPLPYKKLGFNSVYELFNSMNDIIKVPLFPNMNSPVKIIIDQKSEHIRELVVNQKTKKLRKSSFKKSSRFVDSRVPFKSRTFNTFPYYKSRGYDHVKKSISPKPNGIVSKDLQNFVEYLCKSSNSQSISLNKLKSSLITHPDYEKLGTTNIEVAINMLKYFIYIDKGGVHLKDLNYGIFSPEKRENRNISTSFLDGIVDENEELLNDDDLDTHCFIEDYTCFSEDSDKLNYNFNNLQLKNSSTVINQEKKADTLKTDSILKDELLNNNIQLNIGSTVNSERKKFAHLLASSSLMKNGEIDYKNVIISIIASSQAPMTVKEVLNSFKIKYGYNFPFEKLSCRTSMDFFRLYPALFKLDNQYSTNSLVMLYETAFSKGSIYYRKSFMNASILHNQSYLDTWNLKYAISLPKRNDSCSIAKSSRYQKPVEDIGNTHFAESVDMHDSEMVLESMKKKMRTILLKYEKGILCNEFMDIYAKEYNSQFTFYEYGFRSMKDMAYKLPSVFYVKVTEDECILFHASRKNELDNESNFSDPSQYYKNIPKTVLHNLSLFFDHHRGGIKFDDLKILYCSQFGKCYEPLKYGYTSERHMFESLNKMVEIKNNVVFTKDPFAYAYFLKNEDTINNYSYDDSALQDYNFLMNYPGKDICNGKFEYPEFPLSNLKSVQVVTAEIYNPNSFYVHLASQVRTLEIFMANLQEFYDKFKDQYTVQPKLITPGLVCTSCFEYGGQWHRAIVLKVVDEEFVSVLYVDYGSIETVEKSSIRLLKSEFGNFPIQSLHCRLYDNDPMQKYPRELNEYFARLVEGKPLEANMKHFISTGVDKKMLITLYLNENNNRININKQCSKEIKMQSGKLCGESIRRTITALLQDDDIPQDCSNK